MTNRFWFWALLMVMLAGCGGGAQKSAAAPRAGSPQSAPSEAGYAYSGESKSSGSADYSEPGGAPAPATASAPARGASMEPSQPAPPRERPGLGTEWGESRTSRVHDVAFVRSDADRPFALATLNYNDRAGVDALASHAANGAFRSRDLEAAGGAITVSIRDGSGDPLEALHVNGRTFVVGQSGQRYTIVLENHTSHRFEAVATVDGLDVINGKAGTFDNRGYVLLPFATLEIDGFRQSQSAVAAFRFASVADSYAAQTGSARNVGVIGVAFFTERGDSVINEREIRTRDTANPFPAADPRYAQPPQRR